MPWLMPLGVFSLRPHESNREGGVGFAAGAFILLSRAVYEAVGGHTALRNAVLDDVEIGRLIKCHGHRLIVYDGHDVVRVTMYHSVPEWFDGMVKNISYVVGGRRGRPLLAVFISFPVFITAYAAAFSDWQVATLSCIA